VVFNTKLVFENTYRPIIGMGTEKLGGKESLRRSVQLPLYHPLM